jgi:hypothetical protein
MSVIKLLAANPFIGSEATARLIPEYLETRGHTIGPIEFEPDGTEPSLSGISPTVGGSMTIKTRVLLAEKERPG